MTALLNGSAISPQGSLNQEVLHTLERTGQKQLPLFKPVLLLPSYVITGKIFNHYASQFPNI